MAIGKKFLEYIGFSETNEYEDGYYQDEYVDDAPVYEEPEPRRSAFDRIRHATTHTEHEHQSTGQDDMRIVLLQPIRLEEAQTIARGLLDDKVMVFDLQTCDVGIAQDIVNFVSGTVYALKGSIQKVNEHGSIFVATPPSVGMKNELRGGFSDGDYGPTIAEWVNTHRDKGDF